MLIWNSNYIMPSDLKDRIKNAIEEDHLDKTRFYSSFQSGDKFSDLLITYYSEVIKDMMSDLGMFKRSQLILVCGVRCITQTLIVTHFMHTSLAMRSYPLHISLTQLNRVASTS